MPTALIGRKIGMTRLFDESGRQVPVTVLEAGPCMVSQIKNVEQDGYCAVQLAYVPVKARRSTFPVIGHDAKAGLGPHQVHREVRIDQNELENYEPGQKLTVEVFDEIKFVDVVSTSKGKGYAGVVKRFGFKGQLASHGVERKHRSPGSVGGRSANLGTGKPKKGIRMSGRQGNRQATVRSLPVVACDKQKNLLMVKGPVPGSNQSVLLIRQAKRLYHKNKGK